MHLFGKKILSEMPDNCVITGFSPTITTASDTVLQVEAQQAVAHVQKEMQDMRIEIEHQRAQMHQDANTPFDETDDFRDYVVWLCGYTQRKTPPSQEEWEELREETKKVAAKFALRTRTKRALQRGVKDSHDRMAYSALSGQGITSSTTLTANEETLTNYTGQI